MPKTTPSRKASARKAKPAAAKGLLSKKVPFKNRTALIVIVLSAVVLSVILAVTFASSITYSLWADSAVPATVNAADSRPVEVGMKFQTSQPGIITGVKFYKGRSNTGMHTGALWSSTGQKLAAVTFANETAKGWQKAYFTTPVTVAANTTYVVSYFAPRAHYSYNENYFAIERSTGPLTGLSNNVAGGNGVYHYDTSGFPMDSYKATNYWVDVIMTSSTPAGAATPAPTVAPAVTIAPTTAPVTAPTTPQSNGACPTYPATPTASCTGVIAGTALVSVATYSSSQEVANASGVRTVANKLVAGDLDIASDNVVVKNTRVKGRVKLNGHSNITFQNTDLGPDSCPAGGSSGVREIVGDSGYSLINTHVHHNNDDLLSIGGGKPVLIQDSLIDSTCYSAGDHLDAVQWYDPGAVNQITIVHSTIDVRPVNTGGSGEKGNAAIFWADGAGAGSTLTMYQNRFAGGNVSTALYDATSSSRVVLDVHDNTYVNGSFTAACSFGSSVKSVAFNGTSGVKFVNNKYDDGTTVTCN